MSDQTTLPGDQDLPAGRRPVAFELVVPVYRVELRPDASVAERLPTAQPEGTCSIGVAAWDGGESADELITRADRARYAAKAGGRNRCLAARPAASRIP